MRGGGLTQVQQPPVQQSQLVQQVQAQQQTQLQAQPAMMLEHQRQLQVEKAKIGRRDGRGRTEYLASARSDPPSPVAVAASGWVAALAMFGLAFAHRRREERGWAPLLARARGPAPLPYHPRQRR